MKISLPRAISRVTDQNEFSNKVALHLRDELDLPEKLFEVKLSCGSQRSPLRSVDYYRRAAGILKNLVENPQGLNKLRRNYSKIRRGVVRPPKSCKASYYPIKVMVNQLVNRGYLSWGAKKGYYASEKGKSVLSMYL